jgi:hypothetical protein
MKVCLCCAQLAGPEEPLSDKNLRQGNILAYCHSVTPKVKQLLKAKY